MKRLLALVLITGLTAVLASCGTSGPPAAPINLSSTTTDSSGTFTVPHVNQDVTVHDEFTGQPVAGLTVNVATEAGSSAVLVSITDPTGKYAPKTIQVGGPSTTSVNVSTEAVEPLSTGSGVALQTFGAEDSVNYILSVTASWWSDYVGMAYNCNDAELTYLQAQFTPDLLGFLTTSLAGEAADVALGSASGGIFGVEVIGAVGVGTLSVDGLMSTYFAIAKARGYADNDQFRYCVKKVLYLVGPGPVAFVRPLNPPDTNPDHNAEISGSVTDVSTGAPIPGAYLQLEGPEPFTMTTGADGSFSMGQLIPGPYTLSANVDGYWYAHQDVQATTGATTIVDFALTPKPASGEIRIQLKWGARPTDLDSHLWTPPFSGTSYHIYWASPGSADSPPYAWLDHDDTTSYGPEVITIKQFTVGTYTYAVHNYSGEYALGDSGATVEVFDGSGLKAHFAVGQADNWITNDSSLWWDVFTLDGSTLAIKPISHLTGSPPVTAAGIASLTNVAPLLKPEDHAP